jgi:hypothetical protein
MVVHAYNPSTLRLRQEDPEFQDSLRYSLSKILSQKTRMKQTKQELQRKNNLGFKVLWIFKIQDYQDVLN